MVNKKVQNAYFGATSKMIEWFLFFSKPFTTTVIQVYDLTSNAEEAELERFYEDLQDFVERTPQKDVLFIIGDWNAKVGSQETPEVTGKFGLGIRNEAGQRLIEFCQENALVIANKQKKNWKYNCLMTQQSLCWTKTLRKPELKETRVPQCSSQHCL